MISAADDQRSGAAPVRWTLTRERSGRGTFRRLQVMVDGERVARLATSQSVQLELAPGRYRLRVSSGLLRSDERRVECEGGERYEARFRLPYLWGAIAARTLWPTTAWTIDIYRLNDPHQSAPSL